MSKYDVTIESNVPVPGQRGHVSVLAATMGDGDSVVLPKKAAQSLAATIRKLGYKAVQRSWAVRHDGETMYRVWKFLR